jgi:hypothetical protein
LKKQESISDLELYYEVEYRDDDGNIIHDELIPNGANKIVEDIDDYIKYRIDYLVKKYKPFTNEIKNSIYKV